MKIINTISKTTILTTLLLSTIFINSCKNSIDRNDNKEFKISMQKINGEWINATYTLPKDSYFFIETNRGSYSLRYNNKYANWYDGYGYGIIRNGIIDYKIK